MRPRIQPVDCPFARKSAAERQAEAEAFVRDALRHQPVDDATVSRQAAKVIRAMHRMTGVRQTVPSR